MIIGFDLETTGLDKNTDKIIEIALVKFDEKTFEIIDTYSTFINPEVAIPELISNLTNIYEHDVISAPTIDDVRQEVLDFIGNTPLLGHNVFFDRDFFVKNNIHIEHNNIIDTFFMKNSMIELLNDDERKELRITYNNYFNNLFEKTNSPTNILINVNKIENAGNPIAANVLVNTLLLYSKQWDNYSVSIIYLIILNSYSNTIPENETNFINSYIKLMKQNIMASPDKRFSPLKMKTKIKELKKDLKILYSELHTGKSIFNRKIMEKGSAKLSQIKPLHQHNKTIAKT